ncbi:MAG TPA: PD-(D/E)XK nuclease family protein [Solirubrobacteraceae bacterium]|jgi:ATP-dependent helicase/DNAse subunit B|nr:PD-(D/E)XK nuclease family protein [Solirubrobacteraceae bacterium]
MPITLVTGPANAGKAEVVLDGVRRAMAHGRDPWLVVPTRVDAEHYLRELAGEHAAIGVRVGPFDALVDELVVRSGVSGQALGELSRELLAASVGSAERGPGFVQALCALFADLRVRRITPARLSRALTAALGDDAAAVLGYDLGGLYARYDRLLERLGRRDAEQRAMLALDRVREAPALWRDTPVLFYGFDDLTALQLDAIETLGRVVEADVTVSLAYEPGRTAFAGRASTFQALLPLAREHRELAPRSEHYAPAARGPLAHLERRLFEPGGERRAAAGAVRLLRGGDERDELRLVADRARALIDSGLAAHEIAVIVRRPARSAELVREVFGAAQVPFALERRRTLGDTAVGRALAGLLRCVPADGEQGGTAGDLLAWLRCPGLLRQSERADRLEAECRRRGVTDAAGARALWMEHNWELEKLDELARAQARGAASLLELAGRELSRLFGAPRAGRAAVLAASELDEARALAAGRSALAELRELARAAPEAVPGSARELAVVLARVAIYSGERPGPGAVAVVDPLALRARRVRALFVTGLMEGEFPQPARPEPLLGEGERARIAESSGVVLGGFEDPLAVERYLFYALASRPEELLFLSWHEADDEGEPASRSLFVDDVCDLFEPSLELSVEGTAGGEGVLGTLAAGSPARPVQGLSDPTVLAGLRGRMWSASSLEKWVGCPVRWFVERLLAPGAFEPDPEPLARGGLAHAALNDTFARLREETGSARPTPATLPRARALLDEALAHNEAQHELSVTLERRVATRRRLRADLARYLEYAAGLETALEPAELELGFGFSGEDESGEATELPAFDLGDGVLLRGRIDRIDVSESGDAVIVDYKSSSAPPVAKWLPDGRLQVALYMRAAEGLLARRVAAGIYQPLSGRKLRPRGAIVRDAELGLDAAATDLLETDELEAILDEAIAAARTAASEAARGELEPRPATCGFGGTGCAYPTICRCER